MRSLPTDSVFTASQAAQCGWTSSSIARAIRSGRLIRVRRGVYTARPVDPVIAALAAVQACRGSVISHRSAAAVHGIPLLRPARRPELTVQPGGTGDLARALLHRATMHDSDVMDLDGVAITSVPRTLADMARARPLSEAVVSLDAALHAQLVAADDIAAVLQGCRSWPGHRRAIRALAVADGRAESPLESLSRLRMAALGIPRPTLQRLILDERETIVARVDFWWDDYAVAGEADGRLKYENDALWAEKLRQERLEELGIVVVRWGWREATAGRGQLLASRLRSGFARAERLRAAEPVGTGFPRLWSVDAA